MSGGNWKEMFLAAEQGDLALVRYHIKMGADPNYLHPEFITAPLIECVRNGHIEVARFLLEHGANPNIRDGFSGETPLSVAKEQKRRDLVNLLKDFGAAS